MGRDSVSAQILRTFLAAVLLTSQQASSEDIDLFANGIVDGTASDSLANVIFVLDNTSNWARQSQQWPDGGTQGQSEVRAIKTTLQRLLNDGKDVNVGIMEFTTVGAAVKDGGYVRFDLRRLSTHAGEFFGLLDTIDQDYNSSDEKRSSNTAYGNLFADVYGYLTGGQQVFSGSGTPGALADPLGYTTPYSVFDTPLAESSSCGKTYIVLVSNPDSNGPQPDGSANSNRLATLLAGVGAAPAAALAGESGIGLLMPEYEEVVIQQEPEAIGYSSQGYSSVGQCNAQINGNPNESIEIQQQCQIPGDCACNGDVFEICSQNKKCFLVERLSEERASYGTNGMEIDGQPYNLDDWTKFFFEFGIPLTVAGTEGEPDDVSRVPIVTYTIDVFNAQPSEEHSALMHSAAERGGGYRQSATNQLEIERALARVINDIIDVNASFAAVTLPLSANNQSRVENKVFIGMFKPASQRKPRWVGNVKQYQLARFDGKIQLADVNLNRAINPLTDFPQSCAQSFWTTDTSAVPKSSTATGPFFEGLGLNPSPASECSSDLLGGRSPLSDSPDGQFAVKGGAGQQIRGQFTGQRTNARQIFTQSGSVIATVTDAHVGGAEQYAYLVGEDAGLRGGDLRVIDQSGGYVDNPNLADPEENTYEGLRPTVHGDVVHSRPLALTYGPANAGDGSTFRLFYGSNDGLLRSLDPQTGQEDWAFIAPEHLDHLQRLRANTPTIDYFGLDDAIASEIGAEPKRYFFDGSVGSFTEYDSENKLVEGLIFPTMRRGGRQIYAFDVSPVGAAGIPPEEPTFLWKVGCPELSSDAGCSSGFLAMGQTWSTPVAGRIAGYMGAGTADNRDPVLVFGGGWDECLDADAGALNVAACGTGNKLYVLNARTGTKIAEFDTEAPVVAQVTPLDIDNDGLWDFLYAADAAGNLYRLNFSSLDTLTDAYAESLPIADWFISHIASSSSTTVRFFNRPAVGAIQNRVFVAIGSGDRERPLKQNYPYEESISNRFYAFLDEPYGEPLPTVDLDGAGGTGDRGMLNATAGLASDELLYEQYRGWYRDLPGRGEQVVNEAAISGGEVRWNTFQPDSILQDGCGGFGTATAYSESLFRPQGADGDPYGQGIPIPPIIVTVELDSTDVSCIGSDCGPGVISDEIVTVCIGCAGFDPIEIAPASDDGIREAYRAEDIDRL